MSQDIDIQARTRTAGQVVFVIAALAGSVILLAQIGRQTTWIEDTAISAQPRFWPAAALILMTGALAAHYWRMVRRRPAKADWDEVRRWAEPLEYVVWFMVFVFAVPILGFLPMSLVFACALTWRLGYRTARMQLVALVFALAVVIVFKAILGVKIPGAVVYEYLPATLRSFFLQYL